MAILHSKFATPEEVIRMNIGESCRRQYTSMNQSFVAFLIKKGYTANAFTTTVDSDVEEEEPVMDLTTLKLPINAKHFLEFLHSISNLIDLSDPGKKGVTTPHNTMCKYRSAMKKLYTESGHQFSAELDTKTSMYLKVIEQLVAKEKKLGLRSLHDGKSKLSYTLYVRICQDLHQSLLQESDSLHAFFTTCWNMMARCDTEARVMLKHESWNNDHI